MDLAPGPSLSRRRGPRPTICVLLLAPLLLAGVALGWQAPLESRFFFQPARELVGTPSVRGIPFEEAWFGLGASLHGWFIPGASPVTVLLLHGNGGNISHRLELLEQLRGSLQASFFLFDYHGYGRSGGAPSEETLYADARAALSYLRSRPDTRGDRLVYFGESLGTAVAVQLALEQPPDRLVLQSPFTSIRDLARSYFPLLPLGALLHTRFPTIERIDRLRTPILIVHGDRDDVVPLEQGRELYEAASRPKCLLVVEGARHDDLLSVAGPRYLEALHEFANGQLPSAGGCQTDRPG